MARKKTKTKILPRILDVATAGAGGYVGDKVTTLTEQQLLKASPQAAQAAPAITATVGILGETMVKNRSLKRFFDGMAIVSFVEVIGNIESMVRGAGTTPTVNGLGYTQGMNRPTAGGTQGISRLNAFKIKKFA